MINLPFTAKVNANQICPSSIITDGDHIIRVHSQICYEFIRTENHWPEARDHCNSNGGTLVTIKNEATNTYLKDTLTSLNWDGDGIWIGLTDQDSEGDWKWITGMFNSK